MDKSGDGSASLASDLNNRTSMLVEALRLCDANGVKLSENLRWWWDNYLDRDGSRARAWAEQDAKRKAYDEKNERLLFERLQKKFGGNAP